MEKNLRKDTFEKFIANCLENNKYGLTEAQIRHYCYFLTDVSLSLQGEGNKVINELYHDNALILEKSRSQFHEMVIFIEKTTTAVFEKLKEMGMLKKDFDKNGKAIIKGRTTVVTDMVIYLNKLNDLVIKFYEEVYQIQKEESARDEDGRIQGSLF